MKSLKNNIFRVLLVSLAALLFLGGSVGNLFLSGNFLWGELEARLHVTRTGSGSLRMECPLMIAPWETAAIKTSVTNTLVDKNTKPQVNAIFSTEKGQRVESQTLALAPLERQPLQWTTDKNDLIYDRLILVNVLQRPYSKLPSHQGACSILVYSLFDMSGMNTLVFLAVVSIFCGLAGIVLLSRLLRPLNHLTEQLLKINTVFLCLAVAGFLSALPRLWGITIIFDSAALLTLTTALTEVFLFPKK